MAMDADVRLLIGVARGGADGDSEALIRKELNEIMGKIKLEAKLDSKSFGEQIRKQLDAISKNGKFYVNLSKINIGAGAIADFRRQLNTVINTLNLDKGTSITLTAEGIGEVKSKIKETATVTDEAARKMAEFNVQIAAMKKQSKNIDTGLGSLSKGATAEEAAQVMSVEDKLQIAAASIDAMVAKSLGEGGSRMNIDAEVRQSLKNSLLRPAAALPVDTKVRQISEQNFLTIDAPVEPSAEIVDLCYRFYTAAGTAMQIAAAVIETEIHFSLGSGESGIELSASADGTAKKYEAIQSTVEILTGITEKITQFMPCLRLGMTAGGMTIPKSVNFEMA